MGLTIHYSLSSQATTIETARQLVLQLHERAKHLPFDEVGDIVELTGGACDFKNLTGNIDIRRILFQAMQLPLLADDELDWADVTPTHLIAFTTRPAEGSEPANIGLCCYPGKAGWSWTSFCKTQYASNPGIGGIKNFIRAHVGMIHLLDAASALGFAVNVEDEGGYFERRDIRALVEEVHEWNAMIAGAVGVLKDGAQKAGRSATDIESEIAKFPNFEHLEAEGRLRPSDNNE